MNPEIHIISEIPTAIVDSDPQGGSEAAVFVHGNPGPLDDWAKLIPKVQPLLRTIAMDLPGFGRSARPNHFDYSISGYVAHFDSLVNYLGIDKLHLVLHDFGGAFGLWWALDHPEKVASITLINTGVLPDYTWHSFARIWQTPFLGELFSLLSTPAIVRRSLNRFNPIPFPRAFTDNVTRYADWKNKQAVLKLYRATRNTESWFGHEVINQLRTLRFNVCVIWGEQDIYLPVKFAHVQLKAFPQAEVYTIPNTGHWPFIDNPQAVLAILLPFLEKQYSAQGEKTHEFSH